MNISEIFKKPVRDTSYQDVKRKEVEVSQDKLNLIATEVKLIQQRKKRDIH